MLTKDLPSKRNFAVILATYIDRISDVCEELIELLCPQEIANELSQTIEMLGKVREKVIDWEWEKEHTAKGLQIYEDRIKAIIGLKNEVERIRNDYWHLSFEYIIGSLNMIITDINADIERRKELIRREQC